MKQVAIYTRVSTKSQDTRAQAADLKAWQERQDQTVRWYKDKATGTNMERPGFQRLMDDIARGEVDTLVVWRLDRLGRTAAGLTKLFDELMAAKINLISLRDGLDLSTPAGRLMANVIASVAQYETEVRRERQLAGIAAAKAEGKTWGGSEKGRRLSVTSDQVRSVKRLKEEGSPIASIARSVGLSRPTVYRLLAEPA